MEPFSVRTDFHEASYLRGLKQLWWHSWKAQLRRSGLSGTLVTFLIVAACLTLLLESRGYTPAVNWRIAIVAIVATLAFVLGSAFNRRWRYLQSNIRANRKFSHEENSGLLVLDDAWCSYRSVNYRFDNAWHACRGWSVERNVVTIRWASGHVTLVPLEFVGPDAFARIVEIVGAYAPPEAKQG